jgi:hypothetical protein
MSMIGQSSVWMRSNLTPGGAGNRSPLTPLGDLMQKPTKTHTKLKEIATVLMWSAITLALLVGASMYSERWL